MAASFTRARSDRPSGSSRSRRWCIPPAILRDEGETLEGVQILDEFPDATGLVLWQAVRDVLLWASTPPEDVAGLFTERGAAARAARLAEAGAEPAAEFPLSVLSTLARDPGGAVPAVVALACLQLAHWAAERGARHTSVAFAQAAALAEPLEAAPAVEVGQIAARWGMDTRAETWLRRAVSLARRARDWNSYATAYVELGLLYERRGSPQARTLFLAADRAGRRWGQHEPRARAHHALLRLALDRGDVAAAEKHARLAQRGYGRMHPRFPDLMQDRARLLMARGEHERAKAVLQRLAVIRPDPAERMAALALLARAAAGAEDVRTRNSAWTEALALLHRVDPERSAAAMLEVARTGAVLGDWQAVAEAGRRALEAARRRGEARLAAEAAALLKDMP